MNNLIIVDTREKGHKSILKYFDEHNIDYITSKLDYDDQYVTQIYWNGESFEWDTGTLTSEAFFNPLYDFIPIEEEKKIPEKLEIEQDTPSSNYYIRNEYGTKCGLTKHSKMIAETLNQVIDYLKSKGDE